MQKFSVAEDEDTDFSASVEMTEGETRGPSAALRAPSPQGEGNAVDWAGNREEYSMRSITYIGGGVNINGIKIRFTVPFFLFRKFLLDKLSCGCYNQLR